jgi:hypothetical protein
MTSLRRSENFVRARRQVILLFGGDKTGEWSEWAVPIADDLYDAYLVQLRKEGVI